MNENLKALWEQLEGDYDLGTMEQFAEMMSVPANRRAFYDQVSPDVDLSVPDYAGFESTYGFSQKKNPFGSGGASLASRKASSAAQKPVRTAEGRIEVVDGLSVDPQTGMLAYEDEPPHLTEKKDGPTWGEYVSAFPELFNRGFYAQGIGGTLKGLGDVQAKITNLIDDDFRSQDSWLWQAGQGIQDYFMKTLADAPDEVLNSTYGQITQGVGQLGAMIATAGD